MSDTFTGLLMIDGKCVPFSFPTHNPPSPSPGTPVAAPEVATAHGWQDGNELTERIAALESENVRLKARCKAAEGFVSDIRNFTKGENRRAGIRTALTKYESLEGEK